MPRPWPWFELRQEKTISGNGDPNGVVQADKGDHYIDVLNENIIYVNVDGGTTWDVVG
jgi:hypothetical protein